MCACVCVSVYVCVREQERSDRAVPGEKVRGIYAK